MLFIYRYISTLPVRSTNLSQQLIIGLLILSTPMCRTLS
uniref:Uncharacterized protein n=1 Tax=Anguilla anguilla TaxID=7936 RepID=A0A0E9TU21_ANGAN